MAKRTATATKEEQKQRAIEQSLAEKHDGKHDCKVGNCFILCTEYYFLTGGKWTNDFQARNELVFSEVGNDTYRQLIGV